MIDNTYFVYSETAKKDRGRKTALLALVSLLIVCFFSYLGTKVDIPFKAEAIASSPFDNGLLRGCAKLCFGEVAAIAVISLCKSFGAVTLAASGVLALRCAAMGASGVFCMANAMPHDALAVLVSYSATTLLLAVYAPLFYSIRESAPLKMKILIYGLVTGTAACIRIIPYLLITIK